jgi:hypothetical protein
MPQQTLGDFSDDQPAADQESAFDPEVLERIEDESFYNHSEVDLDEVQERQRETQELLGGPDALENFVKSGLDLFGCTFEPKVDGTYEIRVTADELRGQDIQHEYERVTFDPNRAAEDADIEMLDIAHPLVQRLIESVKEVALTSDDRYGRTAMRGTDAVDETVALYTWKVRYFAHTGDNPTVMEELLQTALPLYGNGVLPEDELGELREAETTAANRTEQEWKRDLENAIDHDDKEQVITKRADERRQEIAEERSRMREKLEEAGYGKSMSGIDNLSVASKDLLTIGLYYPYQ